MKSIRSLMNLNDWELVLQVLSGKSMALVATENGLNRSQLSRRIAALETQLDLRFFERSGPVLLPTQRGLEAARQIAPIVQSMKKALEGLRSSADTESGSIRLGSHPGFMQKQVVPMLLDFQKIHPDITFDVITSDDPQAYMRGQTDLMLYYGPVNLPALDEHFVTRSAFTACASPEYLRQSGYPAGSPADLIHHAGIVYTGRVRPHFDMLELGASRAAVRFKSRIRFNSILAAREAALAGGGILLDIPLYHCYQDIVDGKLVPVLGGWHAPNLDNYIACTQEASRLRRVQLFVDWYVRKRREIEGAQKRHMQEEYGLVL